MHIVLSFLDTNFQSVQPFAEDLPESIFISNGATIQYKHIDSKGVLRNVKTFRFSGVVNVFHILFSQWQCFCVIPGGSFFLVGTNDGKISICSVDLGLLFSQSIVDVDGSSDRCFVGMQWLGDEQDGTIVTASVQNELFLISNIHLHVLDQSFRSNQTVDLLEERKKITLSIYNLSPYFSSVTMFVRVGVQSFNQSINHSLTHYLIHSLTHSFISPTIKPITLQDSSNSILVGGIGEFSLLRITFSESHFFIINKLRSSLLHANGIVHLSFLSNCILAITDTAIAYLLDFSTFFVFSYFDEFLDYL